MPKAKRTTNTWALLGVLACAAALPARLATADWLVTKEGGRLETQGPWQVKGKLVVFTLPNGMLSSVRSEQVDFDASRRATERAASKPEKGEANQAGDAREVPKKKSVLVLTDKDFKHTAPALQATGGDASGGPDAAGDKAEKDKNASRVDLGAAQAGSLQVISWDRAADSDAARAGGVQLTGTVRNTSGDHLTSMTVVASLFDENGTLVARVPAQLAAGDLAPGQSSTFSLTATGTFRFSAVKWDAQGHGFRIQPKDDAAKPGGTPPPATTGPTR